MYGWTSRGGHGLPLLREHVSSDLRCELAAEHAPRYQVEPTEEPSNRPSTDGAADPDRAAAEESGTAPSVDDGPDDAQSDRTAPLASGDVDAQSDPTAPLASGDVDAVAAVEVAATELAALTVESLEADALDDLLRRLRRPIQQLQGVRARAAAASQALALRSSNGGASGPVVREHQRQLAQGQQLTPSEAKRQIDAGRAARDSSGTRRAMAAGDIGPEHAQRIAQVLAAVPESRREEVERELLGLAEGMDALAFGRAARRILGRERPATLARDERRRHLDRSFRATDTEDGGFAFSGLLYGAAAQEARSALQAFRRPDTPDEFRTPAQRGADAFQQLCAAALRLGEAPTQHGVRPHVAVVFTAEQYAALSRMPDDTMGLLVESGNVASGGELRQLVSDCDLFRVVLGPDGIPLEVSSSVRTVPIGLWRALVIRDGGCVWPGCDAPASWCDVAHGNEAFAGEGRLSPTNALLLCRRHHRRFDRGPFSVQIEGDRVTINQVSGGQLIQVSGGETSDPSDAYPASPRTRTSTEATPAAHRDGQVVADPDPPEDAIGPDTGGAKAPDPGGPGGPVDPGGPGVDDPGDRAPPGADTDLARDAGSPHRGIGGPTGKPPDGPPGEQISLLGEIDPGAP